MLRDSNVYGSVVGLWRPSNSFHSPMRVTLYSMPYTALSSGHPTMRLTHGAPANEGLAVFCSLHRKNTLWCTARHGSWMTVCYDAIMKETTTASDRDGDRAI